MQDFTGLVYRLMETGRSQAAAYTKLILGTVFMPGSVHVGEVVCDSRAESLIIHQEGIVALDGRNELK